MIRPGFTGLAGCDALTGTLQAGMRSGFLFVRSDAVRRFSTVRVRCPYGHTTSGPSQASVLTGYGNPATTPVIAGSGLRTDGLRPGRQAG